MVGAFLPFALTLPPVFAIWLWSFLGKSGEATVAAILVGASLFVAFKALYAYFSLLFTLKQAGKD
ncbi:hypothetical protein SAMN05444004_104111 [Jannaschia faecimaris]|uniref:Uncharacterized protein n=1 Tax=Jannaschia faecimaris TaxID=1244108 RepID=A0A1H3NU24_9RHOB|nr:hypothetical protein [Jannaschia faecimaris]SDY92334.1 hypothetical protein SAMN05444004_104111 [Jannaschia faecimaris]